MKNNIEDSIDLSESSENDNSNESDITSEESLSEIGAKLIKTGKIRVIEDSLHLRGISERKYLE